ncbi:MAG: hypothetical protein Fur002_00570 [Anaerolineales bacterium]
MSASLGLFRLQQTDRQAARIRAQQESIRQTLANDSELQAALQQAEAARAARLDAANQLKRAEAETLANKIKTQQSESSLYGGSVKNPKELQDLQKEIAALKKHLITLEERELELMLTLEVKEKEAQAAHANLEILQAKRGSEQKKLLDENAALSVEFEKINEERSAALASVEAELLQAYETLKEQKRGIAVTEVVENACSICGAGVTAALQQSARSAKLAYCSSCGRILYAK